MSDQPAAYLNRLRYKTVTPPGVIRRSARSRWKHYAFKLSMWILRGMVTLTFSFFPNFLHPIGL